MEVWDGLRMLSAEGRLCVREGGDTTALQVTGSDRREVVGPAFSAASRDPEQHRFDDIESYFLRAHEEGLPARLCARAVVRDVRSGRRALLWESGKRHRWGGRVKWAPTAALPPFYLRAACTWALKWTPFGPPCPPLLGRRWGGGQDGVRILPSARGGGGGGAGPRQAVAAGGGRRAAIRGTRVLRRGPRDCQWGRRGPIFVETPFCLNEVNEVLVST
jgi:hypothetical protein